MGILDFWARNFFMMIKQNGLAFLHLCRNLTPSKKRGLSGREPLAKLNKNFLRPNPAKFPY